MTVALSRFCGLPTHHKIRRPAIACGALVSLWITPCGVGGFKPCTMPSQIHGQFCPEIGYFGLNRWIAASKRLIARQHNVNAT